MAEERSSQVNTPQHGKEEQGSPVERHLLAHCSGIGAPTNNTILAHTPYQSLNSNDMIIIRHDCQNSSRPSIVIAMVQLQDQELSKVRLPAEYNWMPDTCI